MITAELEYKITDVQAINLANVLNDIREWKREELERDFAQKFSTGQVPEAFSHVETRQGDDFIEWWVTGLSAIFHRGGSVQGRPVAVIRHFDASSPTKAGRAMRPPWRTWQNVRYFYAMWYATGNDKYKAMAIATHQKQGRVDITAHKFMDFTKEDIDQITDQLSAYAVQFSFS